MIVYITNVFCYPLLDLSQEKVAKRSWQACRLFFLALFFIAEFFIKGRLYVDENGILAKTGNFSPRNDEIFTFAETKRPAIEKYDNGGNTTGTYVDDGIAYVSEPLAVADIDDFLIAQFVQTVFFHRIKSSFHQIYF